MTKKANSKLSFLRRNLKGCPEKLKQTAYFSLIRSFMEYGATVWDPYQKYNSDKIERVQRRAARFVKSRYSRYSSVSDMLDVLGWTPLSQRRQEARLILFYIIINGLTQVPFEGVLVESLVLQQYVNLPTKKNNILDLVFCNREMIDSIDICDTVISDHCLLTVNTSIPVCFSKYNSIVNPPSSIFEMLNFKGCI